MVSGFHNNIATALALAIFTAAATGCGLENKVDELLNPPAEKIRPVAEISVEKDTVKVGSQVTLDGSASQDPQGTTLTFSWALPETPNGSSAALASSTTSITTFVADKGGYYTATLQVTDAGGNVSDLVKTRIDAVGTGANHPPVANAGADLTATLGSVAVLDGTTSYDVDENPISYQWSLRSAPSGSSITTVTSSLESRAYLYPDAAGDYIIRLRVSDGIDTDEDFVTVTASSSSS